LILGNTVEPASTSDSYILIVYDTHRCAVEARDYIITLNVHSHLALSIAHALETCTRPSLIWNYKVTTPLSALTSRHF